MLGSFAIGVLFVSGHEAQLLPKDLTMALTVGLLGGFTTFSAFSLQTFQLFEQGQMGLAATYFVASPLLGLLCAALGVLGQDPFCYDHRQRSPVELGSLQRKSLPRLQCGLLCHAS